MGKVQSKRSVDITTETCKDGVIEEGTGKMGKIEDVDQLKAQVNGDTQHTDVEITDKEKKVESENENEKDIATEKEQNISIPTSPEEKPQEQAQTTGDAGDDTANKTLENGNEETLNESKITEAGTPAPAENGESNKKPKKEKVKKKWSFRSLSFSKKDKQKPDKKNKDEATNGEIDKVPEETNEETAAAAPATVSAPTTEEASGTEAITKVETVETIIITTIETEKPVEKVANEPVPEASVTIVENGTSSEAKPEPEPVPVASPAKVEAEPAPVAAIEEKIPAPVVTELTNVEEVKNQAEPVPQQTEAVVEIKEEVKSEEIKPEEKKDVEAVIAKVEVMPSNDQTNKIETNEDELSKNKSDVEIEVVTNEVKSTDNVEVGDSTIPPPLPTIPPPSQVMVFAETAMSANINTPCPISTQSDSVLVDNETKVQENTVVEATEKKVEDIPAALDAVSTPALDAVENVVVPSTVIEDVKLPDVEPTIVDEVVAKVETSTPMESVAPPAVVEAPVEVISEQKIDETIKVEALIEPISEVTENVAIIKEIENVENAVSPPPPSEKEIPTLKNDTVTQETLEEQIAIIDKVMDAATESSEVEATSIDDLSSLPPPPPMPNTDAANEDDKITDLSVEVSSPLPQNSLDSLPSPPMSSLSPSDVSLPPPPPESPTAVTTPATDNFTTNEQKQDIVTETPDATLPPPVSEEIAKEAITTETETIPPTQAPEATEATETELVNKPEVNENDETVLNKPSLEKAIDEAVTVSVPPAEPIDEAATPVESTIETVVEEIKPKLNGCSNEEEETKKIVENIKAEQKIEENGHQNGHAEIENLAPETSATESLNGDLDHSKVEEPIKEKLSTVVIPPPSQEGVTAE